MQTPLAQEGFPSRREIEALRFQLQRETFGVATFRSICNTIETPSDDESERLDIFVDDLLQIEGKGFIGDCAMNPLSYMYLPSRLLKIKQAIDRFGVSPQDSFMDIGCGLGRVPMFVNLYAGIGTAGVELQSNLAAYGQGIVQTNRLKGVSIEHASALHYDFKRSSVIFMYEPFKPNGMKKMLEILKRLSQHQTFRLWWSGFDHTLLREASFLDWNGAPPQGKDGTVFQATVH